MKKAKLNYEDYTGAVVVMENYMDGALADFENGDVEDPYFIECCINTIKLIYSLVEPLLLLSNIREYEERLNNAKARQISK